MQNAKRTIFIYIVLLYTNICHEQHPIPAILTLGMDEVHGLGYGYMSISLWGILIVNVMLRNAMQEMTERLDFWGDIFLISNDLD